MTNNADKITTASDADKLITTIDLFSSKPNINKTIRALSKKFNINPENICKTDNLCVALELNNSLPRGDFCFVLSPKEITEEKRKQEDAIIPGCIIEITTALQAIRVTINSLNALRPANQLEKNEINKYKEKILEISSEYNIDKVEEIGYYKILDKELPVYYFIRNTKFWIDRDNISEKEFIHTYPDITRDGFITAYGVASRRNTMPQFSDNPVEEDTPRWLDATANGILLAEQMRNILQLQDDTTPLAVHLNGDLENIFRNLRGN